MRAERSREPGGRRPWSVLGGRAAGWWFLLAVVVSVVAANAVLSSEASQARSRDVGPAPEPDVRQGVSVAQREFGLLSGGGFAQAWTLWSKAARSALSQSDFVRSTTECHPALGVPYTTDSTAVAGTSVTVAWHQASMTGVASVVFEDGAWRFVPDPATLTAYHQGRCPTAR